MYPEICKIGPFTIYSYGLSLAVAFLVSTSLAALYAKKHNIYPDLIFNFAILVFISGIVGARIFYVIENIRYYIKNPIEIIMLQRGGLSWFGALFLGLVSGILYLRNKEIKIPKVLDVIIPYVALGQAVGRVGCLLNGCCYGRESEFGIYFVVYDAILIPTQIYSSVILILIFIFLKVLQEKIPSDGRVFFTYLLLYSTKRFFIEFWRADSEAIFSGLSLFQLISMAIFLFSLVALTFIIKSRK